MLNKKYKLTDEFITRDGAKLFMIKALRDIPNTGVKAGDLGGYIEKEENLSQTGSAWVCGDAWVRGNARVCGNARVYGNARVCDDAWVCGNAWVYGDAEVYGNAEVYGDARVRGSAWVCGDARVYGDAEVYGDARVCGNAEVYGDADYIILKGFGRQARSTTFFRCVGGKIGVSCGCFKGSLEEFKAEVKRTHGNTKYAVEYLKFAELMEYHFSERAEEKQC